MSVGLLKVELKDWEQAFVEEYRRKPTKNDIRSRKEIYAKYMLYNRLQKKEKESRDPLKDASNMLPRPGNVKEFKFNPEDQSNLSPPPVSPPQAPTCEESFLVGYFAVSAPVQPRHSRKSLFPGLSSQSFCLEGIQSETEPSRSLERAPKVPAHEEVAPKEPVQSPLGEVGAPQSYPEDGVTANHFLFKTTRSFNGLSQDQMAELRKQMHSNEEESIPAKLEAGKKRLALDIGSSQRSPSEEPQKKRRKLEKAETMPPLGTGTFQWGSTASSSVASFSNEATYNGGGKRENYKKLNLRKGKRNAGAARGRGVKGSSKAMRLATDHKELQPDDPDALEDALESDPSAPSVQPETDEEEEILCDLEDSSECETEDLDMEMQQILTQEEEEAQEQQILELLKQNFGYSSFRGGQKEAIMRIVQRQSTLVCIPTGSGKSLIYQLPALMAPAGSIVLVISPLLSLINDQLKQLPSCLTGATINSSQSRKQIDGVYHAIKAGRVKVLFISPEKLMSHDFQRRIDSRTADGLGVQIHFACIDEAHCISQWSHNFRPSYLRISSILRRKLQVNCILALSATCTTSTRNSICEVLSIRPDNVILQSPVRSNLSLSVSSDRDKYTGLLQLLQSPQYEGMGSIIIYCMFQQDTEHLASFLQSKQFDALPYHAGKSFADRKSVQHLFMSNKLRIVVATVAFGMGVDKSDVRAVIHFSMPRSVEAYVQEVGRAGRDNLPAQGHLFLDNDDLIRSYKLCFADQIDRSTIKRLVMRLFTPPSHSSSDSQSSRAYYISLPQEEIGEEFDVKKEVLDTLLTYLQLPSSPVGDRFRLLPPTSCLCSIQFHSTEPQVLARRYQIIQAVQTYASKSANGKWQCDLSKVANFVSKPLSDVREELSRLQTMEEISYEMDEQPCALARITNAPDATCIDATIDQLYEKMEALQHTKVTKLFSMYRISRYAAFTTVSEALTKSSLVQLEQDRELDYQIERYFREQDSAYLEQALQFPDWPILDPRQPTVATKLHYLRGDIAQMLSLEREIVQSGLIGARLLHGLSSPKYPADRFFHHKFWGAYSHVDFFQLVQMVNQALVAFQRQ